MTFYKQQLGVLWARDPYSVPDFCQQPQLLNVLLLDTQCVAMNTPTSGQSRRCPRTLPACQINLQTKPVSPDVSRTENYWLEGSCFALSSFNMILLAQHSLLFLHISSQFLKQACLSPAPPQPDDTTGLLSQQQGQFKENTKLFQLFQPVSPFKHILLSMWEQSSERGGNLSSSKDEISHRFTGSKTILYALPYPAAHTLDLSYFWSWSWPNHVRQEVLCPVFGFWVHWPTDIQVSPTLVFPCFASV